MSNSGPGEQVYQVLKDLHTYNNERVFEPYKTPLPMPVFTISAASRRSRRVGYYQHGKWRVINAEGYEQKTEVRPDEINIDGQRGMSRSFMQIAATVFHEMSHQAQHHFPDVYGKPSKGDYHNKGWHEACQMCGLQTYGPEGTTKVTDEFREYMKDFPEPERWIAQTPLKPRNVAETRLRKYVCQCSEHIVGDPDLGRYRDGPYVMRAAGTSIQARCEFCGDLFEEVQ